jgi:hypothetical protein
MTRRILREDSSGANCVAFRPPATLSEKTLASGGAHVLSGIGNLA